MFIAAWLGCAQTEVTLQGTVYASAAPAAAVLGSAEIRIVDDAGELLTEVTADDGGRFEAIVPGGGVVFVEITADGYAVTTFPGVVGIASVQPIEDGALYGMSEADRQAQLTAFAGCPGMSDEDSLVLGEIRLDLVDPVTGGSPTAGTGIAEVLRNGESNWVGCYLDAEGRFDPEAFVTGPTGRFLVPGVGVGIYDLAVSAEIATDRWAEASYPLWIPDRPSVVSPWYPAWVPFTP